MPASGHRAPAGPPRAASRRARFRRDPRGQLRVVLLGPERRRRPLPLPPGRGPRGRGPAAAGRPRDRGPSRHPALEAAAHRPPHARAGRARCRRRSRCSRACRRCWPAIAETGVPLAILSSNRADTVRRVLGPENAARIGAYACGASLFGKAQRLRGLLARSGVAPDRALCIGDEIRDLEAARAVGCPFGAVAWGYTDPQALAAQGPDICSPSPPRSAPWWQAAPTTGRGSRPARRWRRCRCRTARSGSGRGTAG